MRSSNPLLRAAAAATLGTLSLAMAAGAIAQDTQRRGRPHGPPPEALAACEGRSDGATCAFDGHHGDRVEGTCRAPEGRPLACMPAHPHGDHPHGPPPGALEACADIAVGDACVVDTPHGTLEGTCESTPSGNACRPSRPPQRQ